MATPNLADAEILLVRDELTNDPASLGYAGTDDAGKARLLANRPKIDNPDPAPQLPKPLAIENIKRHIADLNWTALPIEFLSVLTQHVAQQDRQAVAQFIRLAVERGLVALAEATAIRDNELKAAIDDPNHPAEVLGPNRLTVVAGRLIGGIAASEVNHVLNLEA